MAHTAIAVFTYENLATILAQGGSEPWHIEPRRAAEREFLICVQNRQHPQFREPGAPHRSIFLVGRIAEILPSSQHSGYWFIKISEFVEVSIPDAWQQRNPVKYTTLEEFGIDPASLPPFTPSDPRGMAELSAPPVIAPPTWSPRLAPTPPNAWQRLDAILAQLDRVPDLSTPHDPLEWDEHGLPR